MPSPSSPNARIAIYAGSFDPITHGHEDLIKRTAAFTDHLVVAVAVNVSKQPLFTIEERVQFIREITSDSLHVEVRAFSGLLVDLAKETGARITVRFARPDATPFYVQVVTDADGDAEMKIDAEESSLPDSSVLVQANLAGRTATRKFQLKKVEA